ncbi:MAG: hypothetical protein ACE5FL_08205 [Myxococcota bacterium]
MSDEDGTQQQEQAPRTESSERPLVLLGPAPCDQSEIESLQSGLGRTVVSLDPYFLDAEAFAQLAAAAAIIVPWDLGSQAGLDVVEALRCDERTREIPMVMTSPAPTRGAVVLALHAGASGFIFQPVEAEEIRRHLESALPESEPTRVAGGDAG